MRIPVLLKKPVCVEPRAAVYYEVAQNGIFQVRSTSMYRAVTRADFPVPGLVPEQEQLRLTFPRLPRGQLQNVLAFFDEIYRRYEGEGMVTLFFHPGKEKFRMIPPPQTIRVRQRHDGGWRAHLGVRYGNVPRPTGYLQLGSIHSHADLPAFSSGIDCSDECFEDGLHIVFGNFGKPKISSCASFVVNRVRFRIPPEDVLEPCGVPGRPANPEWLARVECKEEVFVPAPLLPGDSVKG